MMFLGRDTYAERIRAYKRKWAMKTEPLSYRDLEITLQQERFHRMEMEKSKDAEIARLKDAQEGGETARHHIEEAIKAHEAGHKNLTADHLAAASIALAHPVTSQAAPTADTGPRRSVLGMTASVMPDSPQNGGIQPPPIFMTETAPDFEPAPTSAGAAEGTSSLLETFIDIVFDGPPSHESGRFVEVENEKGASIKVGEWIKRADGYWALRIRRAPSSPAKAGEKDQ